MAATEFLATLRPARECPDQANQVAARLMRTKGYPDANPIGVFVDGSLLFYYYRLPEGVLELELCWSSESDRWTRRVSDFITNPAEIREMLGDDTEDEPVDQADTESGVQIDVMPVPLFKAPSV